MENEFFLFFYKETKGFVFSTRQRDIPSSIGGNPHSRTIKALIAEVRRMAIKKSFQLPETFIAECDRDDWIQLSMITMYHCCEKYDHNRPFDNYVRFMVSRRLQDKQRSLLRKNPPTDREVLYLYGEMKKIKSDDEAIARLAEDTNRTVEQLQEIVSSGVGSRVFVSGMEDILDTAVSSVSLSPGAQTEAKEMHTILFACINKLSNKHKSLYIRHEMEDISFKKLFTESCYEQSFATFKRWYNSKIFETIRKCVLS